LEASTARQIGSTELDYPSKKMQVQPKKLIDGLSHKPLEGRAGWGRIPKNMIFFGRFIGFAYIRVYK
jgi:hypothetical protein